jgi:peptidoglycan/LPS O-acetylase OafA/YrhL
MSSKEQGARVEVLDGMRGLAVLLVMLHHAVMYFPCEGTAALAVRRVFLPGLIGVDLFFVLSGYLITSILLRTRRQAGYYRRFYLARFFRIFPLYYAVLGLVFLVMPRIAPDIRHTLLWLRQWRFWTYTTNFAIARSAQLIFVSRDLNLNHFWSLAIEEQFYLFWPVTVAVLGKRGLRWAIVSMLAYSCYLRSAPGISDFAIYFGTTTRWDGLAVGALLATSIPTGVAPAGMLALSHAYKIAIACLGVALAIEYHVLDLPFLSRCFEYPLLAIGFAALVTHATGNPNSLCARFFGSRPLRTLGTYSYALYIFHLLFIFALVRAFHQIVDCRGVFGLLGFSALMFALSFALARASYVLLESPCLRLKTRFLDHAATRVRAEAGARFSKD